MKLEVPKLLLVAFLAGLVLIFWHSWHSSMPAESLSAVAVMSATVVTEGALRSAEHRNGGVIIYAYQQPGWKSNFTSQVCHVCSVLQTA